MLAVDVLHDFNQYVQSIPLIKQSHVTDDDGVLETKSGSKRLTGLQAPESIWINRIGEDMYALAAGAALQSFLRKHVGNAQDMIGMREHPRVDASREAFEDQAAGSSESREFIHF